jgi:hypothetical protein
MTNGTITREFLAQSSARQNSIAALPDSEALLMGAARRQAPLWQTQLRTSYEAGVLSREAGVLLRDLIEAHFSFCVLMKSR